VADPTGCKKMTRELSTGSDVRICGLCGKEAREGRPQAAGKENDNGEGTTRREVPRGGKAVGIVGHKILDPDSEGK